MLFDTLLIEIKDAAILGIMPRFSVNRVLGKSLFLSFVHIIAALLG